MLPTEFVMDDRISRFFKVSSFINPNLLVVLDLALRVPPVVIWLTVYRWLYIPVRIVFAQRPIHKNVWPEHL